MLRIQKVLFATDFSDSAEAAAAHATRLARRYEAELHVLHVAAPSEDVSGRLSGFERAVSEASRSGAPAVVEALVTSRSAPAGVLDYARAQDADLIVMGTRGQSGLSRLVMGSVAEAVVRCAPCPVYTVRRTSASEEKDALEPASPPGESRPAIRRILAPVDFSASSQLSAVYARELAALYDAHVDLLYVTSQPDFAMGPAADVEPTGLSRRAREQKRLEALKAEAGLQADVHVAYSYPQGGILDFARSHGTDLIVIPTHGRTGLKRFLMGSVAEGVIRQAPCPVFTVKSFGKSLLPKERRAENERRAASQP